jgi:predicted transglutaminase-like cysteine proteinase
MKALATLILYLWSAAAVASPALPPMWWSVYAVHHAEAAVPAEPMHFDQRALAIAHRVNTEANRDVTAPFDAANLAGLCVNFAMTKRAALMTAGWPASDLLIAEVVTGWGEHHAVLVWRTDRGDLVLDNLSPALLSRAAAPYRWVREQSPDDPNRWEKP